MLVFDRGIDRVTKVYSPKTLIIDDTSLYVGDGETEGGVLVDIADTNIEEVINYNFDFDSLSGTGVYAISLVNFDHCENYPTLDTNIVNSYGTLIVELDAAGKVKQWYYPNYIGGNDQNKGFYFRTNNSIATDDLSWNSWQFYPNEDYISNILVPSISNVVKTNTNTNVEDDISVGFGDNAGTYRSYVRYDTTGNRWLFVNYTAGSETQLWGTDSLGNPKAGLEYNCGTSNYVRLFYDGVQHANTSSNGFSALALELYSGYGDWLNNGTATILTNGTGNDEIRLHSQSGLAYLSLPDYAGAWTNITYARAINWDTAYGWGDWSTGVDKAFVDALNIDADTLDSYEATAFPRKVENAIITADWTFRGDIAIQTDLAANALHIYNDNDVTSGPDIHFVGAGLISAEASMHHIIDSNNDGSNSFIWYKNNTTTATATEIMTLDESGNLSIDGNVDGVDIAAFKTSYDSHGHGTYDRPATADLTGSVVFSNIEVVDGIVQNTEIRNITTTDIGAEPSFSKNTAFNKNFGTSGTTVAYGNHLHTGVYEPANANIQSHISSTSNPHSVTYSQVGAPSTTGTGASGDWNINATALNNGGNYFYCFSTAYRHNDSADGISLGNSTYEWSTIYLVSAPTVSSDINTKENIVSLNKGLSFINKLNPVSYKRKTGNRTHYGLIAQDIGTLIETEGDFAGYIKSQKVNENEEVIPNEYNYALRYEEFIAPLIKAVQELSQENEQLKSRLAAIEAHLGI